MFILDYEDFSHISLGYETYTDGIQHPLELRKILTGELAKVRRLDRPTFELLYGLGTFFVA